MKINLDESKTTLRLAPRWKKKASEIAASRNLSLTQYIESLIEAADERLDAPSVRDQIAQLQKQTNDLDQQLQKLKKGKSDK